jgi:hypothetical protein
MTTRAAILGLSLLAATSPATSELSVKVDAEPGTDFSKLKTYAWVENQEAHADPVEHALITRAVERELQAKGLQKATDGKPDVRIHYYAKVENKVRGKSSQQRPLNEPSNLRTNIDFGKVAEDTLIVELYAEDSRLTLWRGEVTGVAPRADELQEGIDAEARALFAKYPPPKPN